MTSFESFSGVSVAILHSAVRGVHVYRLFPDKYTNLIIRKDEKSAHKNAVGVYLLNGKLVGHVAFEHSKLTYRWLSKGKNATGVITGNAATWSRRAGGHEIAIDIMFMSKDEEQMQDIVKTPTLYYPRSRKD